MFFTASLKLADCLAKKMGKYEYDILELEWAMKQVVTLYKRAKDKANLLRICRVDRIARG